MALMRGTWVHPKTTTDAIYITYPKQNDTEYQGQRNCSQSIAENRITHRIPTLRNSQPISRRMAMVGRKSRTVNVLKLLARHLEAYLTGAPPPAPEQRVNDRLEQRVTKASIPTMTPLPEIQKGERCATHNGSQQPHIKENHAKENTHSPTGDKKKYARCAPAHCQTTQHVTGSPVPNTSHHRGAPQVSKNTQSGTTKSQNGSHKEHTTAFDETHHQGQPRTIS